MPCHAMLCNAMQCNVIERQRDAMPSNAMQRNVTQRNATQGNITYLVISAHRQVYTRSILKECDSSNKAQCTWTLESSQGLSRTGWHWDLQSFVRSLAEVCGRNCQAVGLGCPSLKIMLWAPVKAPCGRTLSILRIYICVFPYVGMCVWRDVSMFTYIKRYTCIYIYIYTHESTYTYVCTCMYIYIYIHMFGVVEPARALPCYIPNTCLHLIAFASPHDHWHQYSLTSYEFLQLRCLVCFFHTWLVSEAQIRDGKYVTGALQGVCNRAFGVWHTIVHMSSMYVFILICTVKLSFCLLSWDLLDKGLCGSRC